ncbi:2Fe-2S iron-sulfur cluster-binding protein [Pigmentiphaga sp. D-2]|uniref:2Fe-2S iron-sulfur cluster-binding protein n=1 Tax=Pigmentiphaga sp. D-2 TaxID=1002116 RepID=UPI00104EDF4F|nr:2Fe-2S iron-sulfur cluster-binding protein [Pigmentiphaga sp. D-2]
MSASTSDPGTLRIAIQSCDATYGCAPDDTLLGAGLRAGLGIPYECGVGACGTCKFELLDGEVAALRQDAPGLSARDRAKGRWLACQSRPLGDCVIKLRLDEAAKPVIAPRRRRANLLAAIPLTHDITEFRFRADDGADFLAGQYALLALPGVQGARAYSMSNLANGEGEWHFQVRLVPDGAATGALFTLSPGAAIGLDGPYGMAYLRPPDERDVVCIAGGSGLAPMISVARGFARQAPPGRSLRFFYGARAPRDVCGEALLRELPGYGERITYHASVSADQDGGWPGHRGFVHQLVDEVLGSGLADCEIYLAGPPPMIESVEALLREVHQVPPERLHYDRYF